MFAVSGLGLRGWKHSARGALKVSFRGSPWV